MFPLVVQVATKDPGDVEGPAVTGLKGGEVADHENFFTWTESEGREREGDSVREAQPGEIEDGRAGISQLNEFVGSAPEGLVHDLRDAEVAHEREGVVESGGVGLTFLAVWKAASGKKEIVEAGRGTVPAPLGDIGSLGSEDDRIVACPKFWNVVQMPAAIDLTWGK